MWDGKEKIEKKRQNNYVFKALLTSNTVWIELTDYQYCFSHNDWKIFFCSSHLLHGPCPKCWLLFSTPPSVLVEGWSDPQGSPCKNSTYLTPDLRSTRSVNHISPYTASIWTGTFLVFRVCASADSIWNWIVPSLRFNWNSFRLI